MLKDLQEKSEAALAASGFTTDDLDSLTEAALGDAAAGEEDIDPPPDFPEAGPDEAMDYRCPSCGYGWSATPK